MTKRSHGQYRMKAPKKGVPKLRAWGGQGTRKVMTQVILSKKEKLQVRARRKEETRKEIIKEN